ncbi:MAG: ATP-grasp domain-containing protein [Actinobacteria bacterium]|nr:ATP-grasp domain-containing protein [Actinomycetota bacterium]
MKLRVLVSDGSHKNALAIIRNLGKSYYFDILTPFPPALTLSAYSKFSNNVFYVDHSKETEYYLKVLSILKNNSYDVFLPVGLKSYLVASKYREEFLKYTNLLVPKWEIMKIAYNKDLTMEFAEKLGIPTPRTMVLTSDNLSSIKEFPVVIKSSDESGAYVKYCNTPEELKRNYEYLRKKSMTNIIAQEYIKGFGTGFYGVCKRGKLYAVFMHRRIKEFPITGGPSAVAEAYYDKRLFKYGKEICKKLKWDGPLMVEFKYSQERDEYYLIELNPKLWGSLDLTIKAGVNVPEILIRLALGEKVKPIKTYRKVKFRWIFPDEFKVLMSSGETIKEFFKRETHTYTNMDFSDPLPTLFQIVRGIAEGFWIVVDKKKRFPHGVVKT